MGSDLSPRSGLISGGRGLSPDAISPPRDVYSTHTHALSRRRRRPQVTAAAGLRARRARTYTPHIHALSGHRPPLDAPPTRGLTPRAPLPPPLCRRPSGTPRDNGQTVAASRRLCCRVPRLVRRCRAHCAAHPPIGCPGGACTRGGGTASRRLGETRGVQMRGVPTDTKRCPLAAAACRCDAAGGNVAGD